MNKSRERIVRPNPKKEMVDYWKQFTKKAAVGVEEAAKLTGFAKTTIYTAIKLKQLRVYSPGTSKRHKYTIRLDYLAEWLLSYSADR